MNNRSEYNSRSWRDTATVAIGGHSGEKANRNRSLIGIATADALAADSILPGLGWSIVPQCDFVIVTFRYGDLCAIALFA
jgi:hypothetical protein